MTKGRFCAILRLLRTVGFNSLVHPKKFILYTLDEPECVAPHIYAFHKRERVQLSPEAHAYALDAADFPGLEIGIFCKVMMLLC